MVTEREKMLRGELYDPSDAELAAMRLRARKILHRFNASDPEDIPARSLLLGDLFQAALDGVYIEPPFYCDYGPNIILGQNVYMNFGCTILDICPIRIGSNVLFAPFVQVYAASHPMDPALRREGVENGAPVTIGDDCWIGGQAIILPGVSIGEGSMIAAGSVVTRDVPPYVMAAGNPCRVVRKLGQ